MGWPGPITHRQFVVLKLWEREDMDVPDKVCYYLMQIAAETWKTQIKNPDRVDTNKFRIKFKKPDEEQIMSAEELAMQKAAWRFYGAKSTDPNENQVEALPRPDVIVDGEDAQWGHVGE